MAANDFAVFNNTESTVFVKVPATAPNWEEMGTVGSVTTSGFERGLTDVMTLRGRTKQLPGRTAGGTLTCTLSNYLPHDDLHMRLHQALKETRPAQKISLRLETEEEVEFTSTSGSVAISTAGVVTFSGTDMAEATATLARNDVGRGNCIKIGERASARLYTIRSISDANVAMVRDAPTNEVTATANYSIVVPILRLTIVNAPVTAFANIEVGSEGAPTTSLTIAPKLGELPDAEVAATATVDTLPPAP